VLFFLEWRGFAWSRVVVIDVVVGGRRGFNRTSSRGRDWREEGEEGGSAEEEGEENYWAEHFFESDENETGEVVSIVCSTSPIQSSWNSLNRARFGTPRTVADNTTS